MKDASNPSGSETSRAASLAGPVVAALVIAGVNAVLWAPEWSAVVRPAMQRDVAGSVYFNEPRETWNVPGSALALEGDASVTSAGLVLGDGGRVGLSSAVPADRVDLTLLADPPLSRWTVRIAHEPGSSGVEAAVLGTGSTWRHDFAAPVGGVALSILPSEREPSEAGQRPVLRAAYFRFADRSADRLPPLPAIVALATACFFLFHRFQPRFTIELGRRDELRSHETSTPIIAGERQEPARRFDLYGAATLGALGLSFALRFGGAGWAWPTTLICAVVTVALCYIPINESNISYSSIPSFLRGPFATAALAAILLLGFQARWDAFLDQRRLPLPPDAEGFLEIVRGGAWYDTAASHGPWVREPLWIWVNRAAGWVLGENESTLRLMSLLAGLLGVVAVARLGKLWFGPAVGLAAAAGFALSPGWAQWTAEGLRTGFYTLIVAVFVLAWEAQRGRRGGTARGATLLGLLAAAAHLTYISSLAWAIPFLAWRMARDRWRAAWIALALAVAIVPLLPHLAFNYRFRNSHDLFFSSNIHARFYRNYERYGIPGSPDRQRFLENPYEGPPVTTLGYLVGDHTTSQLVRGSVRGAWNLYVYRLPGIEQFGVSKLLTAIYALGLLTAVFFASGRRSLVLYIWLGLPFVYIASLPGFATRLAAPLTAWMWIYAALGMFIIVRTTMNYVRILRQTAPPPHES